MNNIVFKDKVIPKMEDILVLYNDVKWTAYTEKPEILKTAIKNSLKVWTAWDDDKLVGLARVVGDDATIIYIQDILVLNSYQSKGIGSKLIQLILQNYKSVRQVLLLTENTEETVSFYNKNGLTDVNRYNCVAFIK